MITQIDEHMAKEMQRTVEAMKTGAEAGNKRPAQAKFFWDDVAPREKAEADQSAS